MPAPEKNPESEIDALKKEVASLKAEREELTRREEEPPTETKESLEEDSGKENHWSDDLEKMVKDFEPHVDSAVEAIEDATRKHPLTMLAATLVGGIILGSLLSRK